MNDRAPKPHGRAAKTTRPTSALALTARAEDRRSAADVDVVILRRRNDGRRNRTAGCEQERRERAARERAERRFARQTRAARAGRSLTGRGIRAGRNRLHAVAGA